MRKKEISLDAAEFNNRIAMSIIQSKYTELFEVNNKMIDLYVKQGKTASESIEGVRDYVYEKMDGYKKILEEINV
jgi:hypothetical protein